MRTERVVFAVLAFAAVCVCAAVELLRPAEHGPGAVCPSVVFNPASLACEGMCITDDAVVFMEDGGVRHNYVHWRQDGGAPPDEGVDAYLLRQLAKDGGAQ